MNAARVKALIKGGEGIAVEFKECKTALNRNVYEQPLLREKRLALTFPETPNNPLQKYYTVRRRSKK